MARVGPSRSEREQLVTALATLKAVRSFMMMCWETGDLEESRGTQLSEEIKQIDKALAGEANDFTLANYERLEVAAITAHQLVSEHGMPGQLRELADHLDAIRRHLDASGYTEWDKLTGLKG